MKTYTITESKTQLSSLVEQVVTTGQPVVIGRHGRPMVQLCVFETKQPQRMLGAYRDQIQMADDYDQWPEDEAKALGLISE
ncbi:MAG: type II toxin-antitoxin system Phd/YefM family antitoxin [Verrucomicrobia bacterium]|nr:type II toxin-antitoxin system Phd/YefM family antitoxin [Verrucomicrobiota bacterium]MCH8525657.1 type II toxin-antitoxin system Phd/YefM family antitoxin [Kiritimatiellia bacterium]